MKIILRAVVESDLVTLAQMNHELIEDERHENPMTTTELEARMRGWLHAEYEAFLFTHTDGIVGYALLNKEESPPYLRQFFIARPYRRQGYGRAAFELLAALPGKENLTIDVLIWNETAMAFWKSLGFTERSLRMSYRKPMREF